MTGRAKDGAPAPESRLDLYGTGDVDGGAIGDQRRGRCYELACYALTLGSAPHDAVLVHGSIDGGTALGRIGHAWLRLADGRVWEPTQARVYGPEWLEWADARDEAEYDLHDARRRTLTSGHYGPWHDVDRAFSAALALQRSRPGSPPPRP